MSKEKDFFSSIRYLRFAGEMENKFRDHFARKAVNFNRYGGFFFVLLYFTNVFTDFYAFPELKTFAIINRTIILIYGIFCFFIAEWKPAQRHYNVFIIFGYSLVSLLLISYTIIGKGVYQYLYHSGFMLVLVGFFILRIRFVTASIFGIFLVTGQIGLSLFFCPPENINIVLHNSGNILGILVGGMVISYLNEFNMRRSFVQMYYLEAEKVKSEKRNNIIEQDLLIARRIQSQHIPVGDPFSSIFSVYRPMDKVGGDFYDYILFPDEDKIGVFISDVSGHGVSAAFITAMIKTSIVQSGDRINDPSALLSYINECLIGRTGNCFVTALYGIFDFSERSFRYANAGQSMPYLVTPDSVSTLEIIRSVPLAVFTDSKIELMEKRWVNREIAICPGSKMLLYTDGLAEARSPSDPALFFEDAVLSDILRSAAACSSRVFIDKIYGELVAFCGGENFDDDVCMICVEIN
ncbi:MAG: PP2C family protein-serine/threonine phosphatase [Spirochaetota bacterium]